MAVGHPDTQPGDPREGEPTDVNEEVPVAKGRRCPGGSDAGNTLRVKGTRQYFTMLKVQRIESWKPI